MKSIYGLEIIANIALNKAISRIGEKIYRLLYKTYFRTLQSHMVKKLFSDKFFTSFLAVSHSQKCDEQKITFSLSLLFNSFYQSILSTAQVPPILDYCISSNVKKE